jgi:hypothetical protein
VSLLVNDLSFHGQFQSLQSFKAAISQLMKIRQIARHFGRELQCHRGMANALVMADMTMPQAILGLTREEQQSLRSWFTKHGPFWEDVRTHSPEHYLEFNGNVVTDTAVGEVAWCLLNGIDRDLVSLTPSDWMFSPLPVQYQSGSSTKTVEVQNHWDPTALEVILRAKSVPISTWVQLSAVSVARCPLLTFAADAFSPLDGHPFVSGAAQRLFAIVEILNRFKSCFDASGQRTPEGNEIYQDYFTGLKEGGGHGAKFTDSSESEKTEFKKRLTLKHPGDPNKTVFCPWHGKVQTPQFRVHFSWPARADEPLYVVYVGPKLTKR